MGEFVINNVSPALHPVSQKDGMVSPLHRAIVQQILVHKTPRLRDVAIACRAKERLSRSTHAMSTVPAAFRKQFRSKMWSAFQNVLNALNVSESSIAKGSIVQLIRDFSLVDPTAEKIKMAMNDIGYREGTTMSLSNLMDLIIWFIWQSYRTAPSKAQSAFEAIADEGSTAIDNEKLREFIQQFGLDVDAVCPQSPKGEDHMIYPSSIDDDEQADQQSCDGSLRSPVGFYSEQSNIDFNNFTVMFGLSRDDETELLGHKVHAKYVPASSGQSIRVAAAVAPQERPKNRMMRKSPSVRSFHNEDRNGHGPVNDNTTNKAGALVVIENPLPVVEVQTVSVEKRKKKKKKKRKKNFPVLRHKPTLFISSNGFVRDLGDDLLDGGSSSSPTTAADRWLGSPIQPILARAAKYKVQEDDKIQMILNQRIKIGPRRPSALLGVLDPRLPGNFVVRAMNLISAEKDRVFAPTADVKSLFPSSSVAHHHPKVKNSSTHQQSMTKTFGKGLGVASTSSSSSTIRSFDDPAVSPIQPVNRSMTDSVPLSFQDNSSTIFRNTVIKQRSSPQPLIQEDVTPVHQQHFLPQVHSSYSQSKLNNSAATAVTTVGQGSQMMYHPANPDQLLYNILNANAYLNTQCHSHNNKNKTHS